MKKSVLALSTALLVVGCTNNKTSVQAEEVSTLKSGIDMQHMDKSVRPQDDFYRYVNGKWLKEYKLPADKSRVGSFITLRDKSEKDVKAIIDELAGNSYELGTDEQKISDLYKSYMDTDAIESAGLKVLDGELNKIDSIKSYDDLMAYFSEADIYTSAPMGLFVYVDLKDSSRYVTYVSQSGLGLPDRDYYFDEGEKFKKIRSEYLNHIESMFDLAGFDDPVKAANSIMALESQIAKAQWTKVETRDTAKAYNLKSIAEFNEMMPSVDLNQWKKGTRIEALEEIVVTQPSYIEKLDAIITGNSLQDWKTYFKWKLLSSSASLLPQKFVDQDFKFTGTTLTGVTENKPRWKRATSTLNGSLGELIGKVYVKKHFPPQAKQRMNDLIENLRTAYGQSIKELEWMSEETKVQALDKLAKFDPKIGYPDEWKDYSQLNIGSKSLIENMIAVKDWSVDQNRSKLGKPIDRKEWGMNPQTVNAYYNPTKNEIVFPAAILQPPFFNLEADDAVNYGGIGAVIGHEMGHGFDDQGSRFDGDGNMVSWWKESDLEKFKQRTGKLIKQYDAFEVLNGEAHVNGELTQGENIGDLSGLSIAYKAMKNAMPENTEIDGLSSDERFFYGWAQIWRGKMRDEALLNKVATNPHSPSEFRANGPLRNFPPFLELYDVKEGDDMYLPNDERVKIW